MLQLEAVVNSPAPAFSQHRCTTSLLRSSDSVTLSTHSHGGFLIEDNYGVIVAGSMDLTPRSSGAQGELVVLWIVSDGVFFDHLAGLIEGTNYRCPDLQGYVCMVRI